MENRIELAGSVKTLIAAHSAKGRYAKAYELIASTLKPIEPARAKWFAYAADINADRYRLVAKFVRNYTLQSARGLGKKINFQGASNALARQVIADAVSHGVPPIEHLIRIDTFGAVNRLGLSQIHYAANADIFNLLGTGEFYRCALRDQSQIILLAAKAILWGLSGGVLGTFSQNTGGSKHTLR